MQFGKLPSPFPGMRLWGAVVGRFHFVISLEDGTKLRPEDREEWIGYTASYKSYEGRNALPVRIDGRWQTFTEAEQACRDAWRQLRLTN